MIRKSVFKRIIVVALACMTLTSCGKAAGTTADPANTQTDSEENSQNSQTAESENGINTGTDSTDSESNAGNQTGTSDSSNATSGSGNTKPATGGNSTSDTTGAGSASGNTTANTSDDKTATETAGNTTADQASDDSEEDSSPFILWEYEGYVDGCTGYLWRKDFVDCDYDGDGKQDRLNRSWDQTDQTAVYTIEFGNGDRLTVPEGWETGFPHVQSGDLDGDDVKEILVTLTYDTSTDPYSFGDMWLFHKDASTGKYIEVDLPLSKGENGAKGFTISYDKPQDGKIRFTVKEAGMSKEEALGDEYISYWWTDEAMTATRPIYWAEMVGSDAASKTKVNQPFLRCYLTPFPRYALSFGFNLSYRNGKYVIGYVEIDEPHN